MEMSDDPSVDSATATPGATGQTSAISVERPPQAFRKLVEYLRRHRELWAPFADLGPEEILAWQNVREEIEALKTMGVSAAWELVLMRGPRKCRHVRRYVGKQQRVRNPAAVVKSMLS